MSEAAAKSAEAAPDTGKKSRKGLIVGLVAGLLVLGGGGGGAAWWFLGRGEPDPEVVAAKAQAKREASRVFVTLDPFVVNLADRDAERYAQVGVVLEVEGPEANKKLTDRMPAVRNEILLLISSKQAQQLTTREGKEQLAGEIALAAARPLGWKPPAADAHAEEAPPPPKVRTSDGDKKGAKDRKDKEKAAKDKKAEHPPEPATNPIALVHFASFIVQ
jgi:flagellar FliL protein